VLPGAALLNGVLDLHPGARAIRSRQIEIAAHKTITNGTQRGVVISYD
jgi:hypothetical protein